MEEKKRKRAISLQPALIKESRKLVREICVPYINDEQTKHYMSGLRGKLQVSCILTTSSRLNYYSCSLVVFLQDEDKVTSVPSRPTLYYLVNYSS